MTKVVGGPGEGWFFVLRFEKAEQGVYLLDSRPRAAVPKRKFLFEKHRRLSPPERAGGLPVG